MSERNKYGNYGNRVGNSRRDRPRVNIIDKPQCDRRKIKELQKSGIAAPESDDSKHRSDGGQQAVPSVPAYKRASDGEYDEDYRHEHVRCPTLLVPIRKDYATSRVYGTDRAANHRAEHKEMYSRGEITNKLGYQYMASLGESKGHESDTQRNKAYQLCNENSRITRIKSKKSNYILHSMKIRSINNLNKNTYAYDTINLNSCQDLIG